MLVLGDHVFEFFGHFEAEIKERLHAGSDSAAVGAVMERQTDGFDCIVGHAVAPGFGKSPALPAGCEPIRSADVPCCYSSYEDETRNQLVRPEKEFPASSREPAAVSLSQNRNGTTNEMQATEKKGPQ